MAVWQMLDKNNSKTLEKEEVCEFVKKLINIIVRNVKNSVHVSQLHVAHAFAAPWAPPSLCFFWQAAPC